GTEVGASVSHQNPLDGGVAKRARLTTSVSHLKMEMGSAYLAAGADISVDAGSFVAYG
ncbi:unnamed protein product, partial [marine sediment metagenome]